MTAYRFCRTDDMALLVAAYERCRGPEERAAPPLDREGFKKLVRELDLWCSSSMVAMEGGEPVAVLLGAKRPDETLVYALRVHPAHRRRGHGRHLLTSLGQKLAILGPPRLVAEIPAERGPARALFEACRWRCERRLVDWQLRGPAAGVEPRRDLPIASLGVGEALASGLVADRPRPWQRALATLEKTAEEVVGLGFYSPERLEAFVLARPEGRDPAGCELVALGRAPGELAGAALAILLDELTRRVGGGCLRLARAAPEEMAPELLTELGFSPGSEYLQLAGEARAA